jgi:predicted RNA-binding protein with PIN domain
LKPLVVVDGYNVIHADKELEAIARSDLELSRTKLVEKLADYAASSGEEVTVVFDASKNQSNRVLRKDKVLGIEVYFSRSGETADSVVEKIAFDELKRRPVCVVTSDYDQQKVLFAKGAYRRTPAGLFTDIRETDAAMACAGRRKKRRLVEDHLDEEVKQKLRKLIKPEIKNQDLKK